MEFEFDYLLQIKQFLLTKGADFALTLIKAILVWVIGKQIIKLLNKAFDKIITVNRVDISLQVFLKSIVHYALLTMLIMTVLTTLGIEMTSFFAIIGAAGLAVGLALQGSLANFAGGVLILLLKPFKVGDSIEAKGVSGTVSSIQIFHTIVKTFDNKTIIIPNGPLYNDVIINNSTEETRTVEWSFNINYGDDIDKARSIIKQTILNDSRILDKENPNVVVSNITNSNITIRVRGLVKNSDYATVQLDQLEAIKKAFDKASLAQPSSYSTVHIVNK